MFVDLLASARSIPAFQQGKPAAEARCDLLAAVISAVHLLDRQCRRETRNSRVCSFLTNQAPAKPFETWTIRNSKSSKALKGRTGDETICVAHPGAARVAGAILEACQRRMYQSNQTRPTIEWPNVYQDSIWQLLSRSQYAWLDVWFEGEAPEFKGEAGWVLNDTLRLSIFLTQLRRIQAGNWDWSFRAAASYLNPPPRKPRPSSEAEPSQAELWPNTASTLLWVFDGGRVSAIFVRRRTLYDVQRAGHAHHRSSDQRASILGAFRLVCMAGRMSVELRSQTRRPHGKACWILLQFWNDKHANPTVGQSDCPHVPALWVLVKNSDIRTLAEQPGCVRLK